MTIKLQSFLAIALTAAACSALAATSGDVRINSSTPQTSSGEKIQETGTQLIDPSMINSPTNSSPERIVAPPKETSPQWVPVKAVAGDLRTFELAQGDQCVRVLADNTLRLQPCTSGGRINWSFWKRDRGGIVRDRTIKGCLLAPNVIAGNPKDKKVRVAMCPDGMQALLLGSDRTVWRSFWSVLSDGRIVLMSWLETDGKNLRHTKLTSMTPQCLEYSPQPGRLIVAPCAYKKATQTWKPYYKNVYR